jgi:CubicO group peptidase (beta-lactamase class C family)
MKKLALVFALIASPALADPPAGFDARVEAVRRQADVPGMAVAIVEGGRVVLAKGYGVRRLGGAARVDADTIFMTGSTGKAVTVAALATLVDAGKLGWDDKVTDRLPGFQMYDPWVTREMTVRDLLTHRSGLGLGAGDLMMVPRGRLSRAEIVRRLRFIKPATSFRSVYAYDNVLYVVAGQLVEAVSGQPYEDYVREHVFRPAGLRTATSDAAHRLATANRALPHARLGAVRGLGEQRLIDERDELSPASTPAGLLAMSANDLARWIQVQLAHGAVPGGGRLFSEAQSVEMWKPHTIEPINALPPELEGIRPGFQTYALGWEVRDYHGARVVWHAGGVFGYTTIVALLPDRDVGFAVTINAEDSIARMGLMYELLDHYLGLPAQDWPSRYQAYLKRRLAAAAASVGQVAAAPAGAPGPSAPLATYAGPYDDAWYGRIAVGRDARGLTIDFTNTPRMTGRLEHYRYDTFVARFDDPGIEPAFVTFALDADGKVARATLKPVSPTADFSFDYQDLSLVPAR